MRAQKVDDLSMEDILSSIRKIISEDSKEANTSASTADSAVSIQDRLSEVANQAANSQSSLRQQSDTPARAEQEVPPGQSQYQTDAWADSSESRPVAQAKSSDQSDLSSRPSAIDKPVHSQPASSGNVASHSPQPAMFSERRENLDVDNTLSRPRQSTPDDHPVSQIEQAFAEKPNPMIRPAVQTASVPVNGESQNPGKQEPPANRAVLQRPGQTNSGGIPGFLETKPPVDAVNNDESAAGKPKAEADARLHPAIANAKSFVSSQGAEQNPVVQSELDRNEAPAPERTETPVFANPQTPVEKPVENLISPDSADRREVSERRNHPLRRGVDRLEREAGQELMSPMATDSVHTAFEQLKTMTTENLDSNVQKLIRPMLREWLDNNLPSMVERLVRDEIERVSRGE